MQMKMLASSLLALSVTLSFPSSSQETPGQKTVNEKIAELERSVARLPIKNVYFGLNDKGSFLFSEGGRFVFEGKVYDGWQKKYITNLEEAKASYVVPLERIGINPATLGALHSKEEGEIDLVVFTDPNCTACDGLYEKLQPFSQDYKIAYVLTNLIGGDESTPLIKRLYCEQDKQKALKSLVNSEELDLPDMKVDQCDYSRLFNNLAATQVLGISQLPTLVNRRGRIIQGVPKALTQFLKEGDE
ncbi:thioredoxin fold domain-containing protein [Pseudoalteromonas sp. T1lg23B]|uniref:thioredoxin fold domain-containing protein n=1 Tax=Pseudoalteromonas sp. T1lg23B TaxID=2077097 RepID=UPI000CF5F299|nr:thioredoxin fold domain-containing protein [Pseudoalteromonas sp. T1lg23B]